VPSRCTRLRGLVAIRFAAAVFIAAAAPVLAQPEVEVSGTRLVPGQTLAIAVDRDDDDEDGVEDRAQLHAVPGMDLLEVVIQPGSGGDVQIATLGGLRVIRRGEAVSTPFVIKRAELPAPILLQATRASSGSHSVALLVTQDETTLRVPLQAVEIAVLAGSNEALDAARDALAISHRVTNDPSLPRGNDYGVSSPDPNNIRVQILDSSAQGKRITARLRVLSADGTVVRGELEITLTRPRAGLPFRSRFVRLVGDAVDRDARGVAGQVLQVALRDRVQVVYETPLGQVRQALRVGRPGDESGPRAARRAVLRAVVLRAYPNGPPVIGVDDLSALRIVREELSLANEIWLQCHITFGSPNEAEIVIADAPGPTMIAVSDGDGLPARGGTVQLRADGRVIGPLHIPQGSRPMDTALRLSQALRSAGFSTTVTVNPSAVYGAGPGADVLVRRSDGSFVHLEPISGTPLTTDPQQRIAIGSVDLGDGLDEFDNMTATSGTLEERTLIKALSDDDPSTIELFIINRFAHGTRQGEAFIAASSGPVINAVVLDRNGLRQRQTAWTLAHEIGHVLLNQPLHPDNFGPDVPSLLMDSDNNRGTVHGPKRLTPADCLRVRHEAELRAVPPLLTPYDPRRGTSLERYTARAKARSAENTAKAAAE
jgi:hypothetical protein